jgi:glycosyltransferase involved in cell wall biosynthesis
MKVLLYADVDLSLPGGLETHIRQLALGLEARGHAVEIFGTPPVLPPFRMVDRVEVQRYDVIHHHGGVWPRGLDAGDRYVRTLHFCTAAKMENYLRIGRLRTLANPGNWRGVREERASVRRAGRLIAVARRVVKDFARFYGLDPACAVVIPNGATFAEPSESRAAIRARFGVAERAPVLLTIGRADFVKGHDLLERAWRAARKPPGSVWVNVGGEVATRSEDRVVTGSLPHEQVVSWIHAADLGAMPSHYEGCSVAMLEMIAGNLFTLAHDVGNAAELLRSGANGRIVVARVRDWSGALSEALAGPKRGASLGDEFRWQSIVERTEAVYRDAIAARPARGPV